MACPRWNQMLSIFKVVGKLFSYATIGRMRTENRPEGIIFQLIAFESFQKILRSAFF